MPMGEYAHFVDVHGRQIRPQDLRGMTIWDPHVHTRRYELPDGRKVGSHDVTSSRATDPVEQVRTIGERAQTLGATAFVSYTDHDNYAAGFVAREHYNDNLPPGVTGIAPGMELTVPWGKEHGHYPFEVHLGIHQLDNPEGYERLMEAARAYTGEKRMRHVLDTAQGVGARVIYNHMTDFSRSISHCENELPRSAGHHHQKRTVNFEHVVEMYHLAKEYQLIIELNQSRIQQGIAMAAAVATNTGLPIVSASDSHDGSALLYAATAVPYSTTIEQIFSHIDVRNHIGIYTPITEEMFENKKRRMINQLFEGPPDRQPGEERHLSTYCDFLDSWVGVGVMAKPFRWTITHGLKSFDRMVDNGRRKVAESRRDALVALLMRSRNDGTQFMERQMHELQQMIPLLTEAGALTQQDIQAVRKGALPPKLEELVAVA